MEFPWYKVVSEDGVFCALDCLLNDIGSLQRAGGRVGLGLGYWAGLNENNG